MHHAGMPTKQLIENGTLEKNTTTLATTCVH